MQIYYNDITRHNCEYQANYLQIVKLYWSIDRRVIFGVGRSLSFWKNNLSELIASILYLLFHVALIIYVLIIRANSSIPVKFARVPGMLLNLNSAFIIMLVLKRLITWFRTSEIGRKISVLDGALDIHKIIGFWLAFLSLVHSFGHFFNFC